MQQKKCGRCKQLKDILQFNKNPTKRDGLGCYCKECQKEYKDQHYRKNKELYFTRNKKYKQEKIQQFDDYKKTLSCKTCGQNHSATLDFHHRDKEEKEINICDAVHYQNWGIERVKKEIDKCDILCANCHRILHYNERQGPIV